MAIESLPLDGLKVLNCNACENLKNAEPSTLEEADGLFNELNSGFVLNTKAFKTMTNKRIPMAKRRDLKTFFIT
jgi:hypothetical protein